MSNVWSEAEVKATVDDYFSMLSAEIRDLQYRKSEHRRALKTRLNGRSEGAIEFKHQNISAVLIKHGQPYIVGYKPRVNYQQILEKTVLDYLAQSPTVTNDFEYFTTSVGSNLVEFDRSCSYLAAFISYFEKNPSEL